MDKTKKKIWLMEVAPRKIDDATSLFHKLYANSTTMWTLMTTTSAEMVWRKETVYSFSNNKPWTTRIIKSLLNKNKANVKVLNVVAKKILFLVCKNFKFVYSSSVTDSHNATGVPCFQGTIILCLQEQT